MTTIDHSLPYFQFTIERNVKETCSFELRHKITHYPFTLLSCNKALNLLSSTIRQFNFHDMLSQKNSNPRAVVSKRDKLTRIAGGGWWIRGGEDRGRTSSRKMGKNRWTRPTFRLQKEIFPWFFLPLFFRRLDGSTRRYTGCPFHRGDTRCRLAESFRGYKINLACKTEMGPWKRSGNRWRKGRTAQGRERERGGEKRSEEG